MEHIDRRTFIAGLGATVLVAPRSTFAPSAGPAASLMAPDSRCLDRPEMRDWRMKDSRAVRPRRQPVVAPLSDFPRRLRKAGVVDVFRNPFSYKLVDVGMARRLSWPPWTAKLKVASYGANSGHTPDAVRPRARLYQG